MKTNPSAKITRKSATQDRFLYTNLIPPLVALQLDPQLKM